ncbi:hypothetical protein [Variovorax sp. MHTC-1]|uniref:hypothetical protein n=1 Tax=Variovorax sp. MHTC-1 TaxID=2495593 RepID=UPI0021AEB8F4|nr:hypothetical protein [Variovorax sp. MHTC-1]
MRSQRAAQTQLASAPMSLAESAKFFGAETARYRSIAKSIKLQPQYAGLMSPARPPEGARITVQSTEVT